jgi:Zn-dependent peptidase ImmA (M78 family)
MIDLSVADAYEDPRAHAVRERYLGIFGGPELPVPVEAIAEDLLGLRIEQSSDMGDCSGMLLPAERLILLNAAEAKHDGEPIRRQRFTIAHEVGHWVCHCLEGRADEQPAAMCRKLDLQLDADRAIEREANVFAAELLMPEDAVRTIWGAAPQIAVVAGRLGVSQLAVHWRLYSFGLVAERPA